MSSSDVSCAMGVRPSRKGENSYSPRRFAEVREILESRKEISELPSDRESWTWVTNRCRRGFAASLRNVLNVNQGFVMETVIQTEEKRLLSKGETARRLGVSRRTLEREVSRKKFPPPLKIGTKSLWESTDVETYVVKLKEQRDHAA